LGTERERHGGAAEMAAVSGGALGALSWASALAFTAPFTSSGGAGARLRVSVRRRPTAALGRPRPLCYPRPSPSPQRASPASWSVAAFSSPSPLWQPGDVEDAPLRIDDPRGYSHGDDLSNLAIDEDGRRMEEDDAGEGEDDEEDDDLGGGVLGRLGRMGRQGMGKGRGGGGLSPGGLRFRQLRWPPTLGEGTVPRIARAVWALVAVGGVVWAAGSAAKHVLFLGMGAGLTHGLSVNLTTAAVDSAALEALGGLAEGALVGLVLAPTAAALTAATFEVRLCASAPFSRFPRLPGFTTLDRQHTSAKLARRGAVSDRPTGSATATHFKRTHQHQYLDIRNCVGINLPLQFFKPTLVSP